MGMRTGSFEALHAANVVRLRARVCVCVCVCLDIPLGHWHEHYTDKAGKDCEISVGLDVPRLSLGGEQMTPEQKMDAARQALARARREWNRLDCSGEARLQV